MLCFVIKYRFSSSQRAEGVSTDCKALEANLLFGILSYINNIDMTFSGM